MRIIKWIFGLLFLAVALAVIVAAYIAMTFDANSYKDRIIKTVKAETGRDLTLNGELTTTFYPWLGMNMNDAGLRMLMVLPQNSL